METLYTFHEKTVQEVKTILNNCLKTKERIRIFYGDSETGQDWREEYGTIGTIGTSTGTKKIPLLIKNKNSFGGGGILDHCIVKITDSNKKVIYQHDKYNLGNLEVVINIALGFNVEMNGKQIALFPNRERAENYIAFLKGERNRI